MRKLYSENGEHINYVPIENMLRGKDREWTYACEDEWFPPVNQWVGLGISHYGPSKNMTGEVCLFYWDGKKIEAYGIVKIYPDKMLVRE